MLKNEFGKYLNGRGGLPSDMIKEHEENKRIQNGLTKMAELDAKLEALGITYNEDINCDYTINDISEVKELYKKLKLK